MPPSGCHSSVMAQGLPSAGSTEVQDGESFQEKAMDNSVSAWHDLQIHYFLAVCGDVYSCELRTFYSRNKYLSVLCFSCVIVPWSRRCPSSDHCSLPELQVPEPGVSESDSELNQVLFTYNKLLLSVSLPKRILYWSLIISRGYATHCHKKYFDCNPIVSVTT